MLLGYCDSGTTAGCLTTIEAINNETCLDYLNTANPALCSGTCDTQVSAAATACADSVSLMVARYNNLDHKIQLWFPMIRYKFNVLHILSNDNC